MQSIKLIARSFLHILLALLIATPGQFAVANPPPMVAANDNGDPQIERFEKLMAIVEKLERISAGDPEREALKIEGANLALGLKVEIQAELAPFEAEHEALKKQSLDEKREIDKEKLASLISRSKLAREKRHMLEQMTGQLNQSFIGLIHDGTRGQPTVDSLIGAKMQVEPGQPELHEFDAPPRLHQRVIGGLSHGAVHFTAQYFTFSMAMGIIALSQIGLQSTVLGDGYQSDPNALENWAKHTFDLLGATGFAFFMLGNSATMKFMKWLKYSDIPPGLMPSYVKYLGMTAGMLAQSVFHDLYSDKDVWKCIKPNFNSKLKPDPAACEKMRHTWLTKGKILQYTPSVLSMLSSTMISSAIRGSLSSISNPELLKARAGTSRIANMKFKGAVLVSKTNVGKVIGKGVKLFPVKLVGLGDFVLFLAVDTYVTAEPINQAWQNLKMNYADPAAFVARNGFHAEFFFPKEGSLQAVADALDIEATTPKEAHRYLMDTYHKLQDANWKRPEPVNSCTPKSLVDANKANTPNKEDDISKRWIGARWFTMMLRRKGLEQRTCEVHARPGDLVSRYSDVNKEWRTVIMSPFSTAQNNWLTMLTQFTTVYSASMKLANHLAQLKFNMVHKGATEVPDLSREALAKIIGAPIKPVGAKPVSTDKPDNQEADTEDPEKANSMFLDNTWLPTPELIDFIVAGFACGPDAKLDPSKVSTAPIPSFFGSLYAALARQISSPSYMTTPWGSSLHFIPPKLTDRKRTICENVQNSFYDTLNIMLGGSLPTVKAKTATTMNPFNGPFTDENKKTYKTLAEFVFENMDADVYKPIGNYTGFATWWANHLTKPITPVYEKYKKVYDGLIKDRYFPLLLDSTYRYGCSGTGPAVKTTDQSGLRITTPSVGKEDCIKTSNAYRVANGYFLSVEIELRNYLRGLYSLYSSTFNKAEKQDDAKKAFMETANDIIDAMQADVGDELKNKDFEKKLEEAEESLAELVDGIALRLKVKPSPDNEFKVEMLTKLAEQIAKLILEERSQIDLVRMWNFTGGAPTRGTVKRVDGPTTANPVLRGGGQAY